MEITYLNEFIKVAETGNYLEAADQLFISQSSLSKHIQTLEKEMGLSLLDRTTRKVKLSSAGEVFFPFAKSLVKTYEDSLAALKKSEENAKKEFTLGVLPSIDSYGISDIVSEYMKKWKDTKIRLDEDDTSILLDKLKKGLYHLAFAYDTKSDASLASVPYATDYLVAVIPKGHPLATQKSVTLKELAKENLIVLKSHTILYKVTMESFKKAGLNPSLAFTERVFLSTFDLHESNSIALFFRQDAIYVNNPGNIVVNIYPKIPVKLSLLYSKKTPLTEREGEFVKLTKQMNFDSRSVD